ncbi:MAG: dienelactone hydrolase family protein [Legionellaceae bacterium]|nr:dienelactone hydrolase family protein [Legionellaceae bacterium]
MHTTTHAHKHDNQTLLAHVAFDESKKGTRPGVLVFHDWSGRNEFACKQAESLAAKGYVGFAADLYGDAKIGKTTEEKISLMTPLSENRPYLLERITLAYQELCALPQVDETKTAAIGFCFGGICVLDLARSGEKLSGVASFHGLLNPPTSNTTPSTITSKVLVLHGYEDPMVKPDIVIDFCDEMTKAKADWQVQMYGHTKHAFTNPEANDPEMGTIYNDVASKRAFAAMDYFLKEVFI